MQNRQGTLLETLRRVRSFLEANTPLLDSINQSPARTHLDDTITRLGMHATVQDGSARGSRGETSKQRVLRLALRFNHMRPIAVLAKQHLRDVPQLAALSMPSSGLSPTPLLVAARAMADAATPHAQALIDAGLPPDFLADLRAAADAVEASLGERDHHRGTRSGATAGLRAEERRGRSMIRVLDSLVTSKLGTDDRLLAVWKAAKQIHRKPGPVVGSEEAARAQVVTPPPQAA